MHYLFFIKSPRFISLTFLQKISCVPFCPVFEDLIEFPGWHFMIPLKKQLFFKTEFLMLEEAKH